MPENDEPGSTATLQGICLAPPCVTPYKAFKLWELP